MPQIDMTTFIKDGVRKDPCKCPVALLLNHQYKDKSEFDHAEVRGSEIVIVEKDGNQVIITMDKETADAIKHFDDTGVWPGEPSLYIRSKLDSLFDGPIKNEDIVSSDYYRRKDAA